jgi:hypothetical protein
MMAFKTMPFLFDQWGSIMAVIAGVAWFGLLFFAGITSSLAMGTPWMGFVQDEFGWTKNKSAILLGIAILIMGLPTILFFEKGVFDEYDYWTGTVSLVVFALAEVILFAWVFGMDKGWKEITDGADMRVPRIYRPIIKYVTPLFIGIIFLTSLFKPLNGELSDWSTAFNSLTSGQGWPWANDSIINQIFHINTGVQWMADGALTNMFYIDMSRFFLLACFFGLVAMVKIASNKRKKAA